MKAIQNIEMAFLLYKSLIIPTKPALTDAHFTNNIPSHVRNVIMYGKLPFANPQAGSLRYIH